MYECSPRRHLWQVCLSSQADAQKIPDNSPGRGTPGALPALRHNGRAACPLKCTWLPWECGALAHIWRSRLAIARRGGLAPVHVYLDMHIHTHPQYTDVWGFWWISDCWGCGPDTEIIFDKYVHCMSMWFCHFFSTHSLELLRKIRMRSLVFESKFYQIARAIKLSSTTTLLRTQYLDVFVHALAYYRSIKCTQENDTTKQKGTLTTMSVASVST